jgi:hypothetical protein
MTVTPEKHMAETAYLKFDETAETSRIRDHADHGQLMVMADESQTHNDIAGANSAALPPTIQTRRYRTGNSKRPSKMFVRAHRKLHSLPGHARHLTTKQ